jgi:hypothetical protein
MVTGIANNTALIAAHRGEVEVARGICQRQIRWIGRLGRRAGKPGLAAHVVQPWVNLGRLDALEGDWNGALERFAQLTTYRATGWLRLGMVCIDGTGWETVATARREFEAVLENNYVIDSLKALLMNRRYRELITLVDGLGEARRADILRRSREGCVVAHARLGEFERAVEIAAATAKEFGNWTRVIFRLRLAEVLASAGDLDAAADVLRPLAAVIVQVSAETKRQLSFLYTIHRLATACAEAGLEHEAAVLGRDVLASARDLDEEVFQIEILRMLATLSTSCSDAERESWHEALDQLEVGTEYRRYRRSEAPAAKSETVEALYSEIRETLEA